MPRRGYRSRTKRRARSIDSIDANPRAPFRVVSLRRLAVARASRRRCGALTPCTRSRSSAGSTIRGSTLVDRQSAPRPRSISMIIASASLICAMVGWSTLPIRRTSREDTTAVIARQMARPGRSTPARGPTSMRSADGARELDMGTTMINSSGAPDESWSLETTTAGRVFPGSPARPAPSATSQISPRRGVSANTVADGRIPILQLGLRPRILQVEGVGVAFGPPHRVATPFVGDLGEQLRHRHAPFAGLSRERVTGCAAHPDGAGLSGHGVQPSARISRRLKATQPMCRTSSGLSSRASSAMDLAGQAVAYGRADTAAAVVSRQ